MTVSGNGAREIKPTYRIELDGVDVSSTIGDRLIALRTTDYAGQQTDTVEIELDDRDQRIAPPPSGATMSVHIGYEGADLKLVGAFLVDEVEFSDGPRGMVIKGLGAAQGGPAEGLTDGGSGGAVPTGAARTVTASWYSPRDSSNRTANGEFFTGNDQTAAHKTLPFGTMVRVTNPATGQSTTVRINDRGPFVAGREIDLSRAAAQKIGIASAGVGQVQFQVLGKAPAAPNLPPPGTKKSNTGAGGDLSGAREYIKLRRTQDWHNPPYPDLLSIARKIAARNQLALEVKGDVPKIPNRHEDQTNESDANFMTRLADRFGLVIKPVDGRLLITLRSSGKVGPNVNIKREDAESWRARTKERARYKVVRAKWLDRKGRKEKIVTARAKDAATGSTFELPELHHTKEDAETAAKAKIRGLTSGVVGLDIVLRGTPLLTAEGTITLQGFRDEFDGQPWVIRSVTHQITGRSVFTTTVQAGTEGDEGSIDGGGGAGGGGFGSAALINGPTEKGYYAEGNIGPTSTGPHYDIKRRNGSYFSRESLDRYVTVNGRPLSSGTTVPGGRFGASRSYGSHNGWDFAFGGGTRLRLRNGAQWIGNNPGGSNGDKASFRTPDGQVYDILHGRFKAE